MPDASERTAVSRAKPRGDKRRRQILDAAIDLFSVSGYRGTGLTAVGARAGVTHVAVLHHFGSKENLLFEVIRELDSADAEVAAALLTLPAPESIRRLPEVAARSTQSLELRRLFLVLQAEAIHPDAPGHSYFAGRYRGLRTAIAANIRHGQRTGEIRADVNPERKATEMMAFMDGVQAQYLLDPDAVPIVELYADYAAMLLEQISVRRRGSKTST